MLIIELLTGSFRVGYLVRVLVYIFVKVSCFRETGLSDSYP